MIKQYGYRSGGRADGMYYDYEVIEGLACGVLDIQVLTVLRGECEYIYSDEGLQDMCLSNDYEFLACGTFK